MNAAVFLVWMYLAPTGTVSTTVTPMPDMNTCEKVAATMKSIGTRLQITGHGTAICVPPPPKKA